jgi:hypothetical protein
MELETGSPSVGDGRSRGRWRASGGGAGSVGRTFRSEMGGFVLDPGIEAHRS